MGCPWIIPIVNYQAGLSDSGNSSAALQRLKLSRLDHAPLVTNSTRPVNRRSHPLSHHLDLPMEATREQLATRARNWSYGINREG